MNNTPPAPVKALARALAAAIADENWMDSALCAQTDPEAFFPEAHGGGSAGLEICRRCPVTAQCLEYSIKHEFRGGTWGGVSEHRRKQMIADRNRAKKQARPAA